VQVVIDSSLAPAPLFRDSIRTLAHPLFLGEFHSLLISCGHPLFFYLCLISLPISTESQTRNLISHSLERTLNLGESGGGTISNSNTDHTLPPVHVPWSKMYRITACQAKIENDRHKHDLIVRCSRIDKKWEAIHWPPMIRRSVSGKATRESGFYYGTNRK
jgi:hypothetical protein